MRVAEGLVVDLLPDTVVREAYRLMLWLRDRGVGWVLQDGRQAFRVGGGLRFWGGLIMEAVGGGQGLSGHCP